MKKEAIMDDNISEMLKGVMSDPETVSKLKDVMSDPEAMSKLMGVAQGLMGGSEEKAEEKVPAPAITVSSDKNKFLSGNEERIALISAIRPYLSDGRRKNADSLIKMLKMMKLADIGKLLGQ